MPLDFSKIQSTSTTDSLINPREIFSALPAKHAKYRYLRDVQAEALDQWYGRRNSTHLRLKMNTGAGKTLLGLMILKSCLNEGKGPAVYVSPTPYLVSQIVDEANSLGLATETEPRALSVSRGQAILVTHIHVLLNGKSKFGIGQVSLPIGSLVLDDWKPPSPTSSCLYPTGLGSTRFPASKPYCTDIETTTYFSGHGPF